MARLGDQTWTALKGRPAILIPVGAVEQHGPHLPLDTDIVILEAILAAFEDQRPEAQIAPTLCYGASGEHGDFPGTLSLGREALCNCLIELGRSADQLGPVLFATWHGGNLDPMYEAIAALNAEGREAMAWAPKMEATDAHAGRYETSLMLAIDPDRVRLECAEPGAREPLAELWPRLRANGVKSVSANGILGDPQGANAEEGRASLQKLTSQLVATWDGLIGATTSTADP